jgi:hypothetical protein
LKTKKIKVNSLAKSRTRLAEWVLCYLQLIEVCCSNDIPIWDYLQWEVTTNMRHFMIENNFVPLKNY